MAVARPAPDLPPAISVTGVRRVYATKPKPVVALDGVDLEVAPGEFFGLLGPNGAGKTTLIKILTTLLLPTSGDARIFGFDIATETKRIRRIMNMVAGGEQSGYGILTVREQLWMFSQFYGIGTRDGWKRTDELIEAVGLGEQRLQRVSTLSTGQRQKMNMARGLLNDPWILFLDEPTLGLDVAAARSIRELVLDWKGAVAGPDRAADDALHGRGRRAVRADRDRRPRPDPRDRHARTSSRSASSGSRSSGSSSTASTPACPALARLPGVVSAAPAADIDPELQRIAVNLVLEEDAALGGVVTALAGIGSHILALRKSEPTLEDVFVELVGRGFGDDGAGGGEPGAATADGQGPDGAPGRGPRRRAGRHRGPAALAQRRRGRGGASDRDTPLTATSGCGERCDSCAMSDEVPGPQSAVSPRPRRRRSRRVAVAVGLATLLVLVVVGVVAVASFTNDEPPGPLVARSDPLLPDLAMGPITSIAVGTTDTGEQRLRFDATIVNIGEGPFLLRASRPWFGDDSWAVEQWFEEANGAYSRAMTRSGPHLRRRRPQPLARPPGRGPPARDARRQGPRQPREAGVLLFRYRRLSH